MSHEHRADWLGDRRCGRREERHRIPSESAGDPFQRIGGEVDLAAFHFADMFEADTTAPCCLSLRQAELLAPLSQQVPDAESQRVLYIGGHGASVLRHVAGSACLMAFA
jgi:hypothetical protein